MEYESIGCVDFGNNNFYEVMRNDDDMLFSPHEEPSEMLSVSEFFEEVPYYHFNIVIEQLNGLVNK